MVPCSKTKALSVFLLILFLFVPLVSTTSSVSVKEADPYKAPDNASLKTDLFSVLSVKAEIYNNNFDKVPTLVQKLAGSEQVAGRIKLENGEMLYVTLLMRGGKVGKFYKYDNPEDPYSKLEPSIIVETNEQSVRKIINSKEPLRDAVNSMNEGSLNVEATGIFRSGILSLIRQIYSS
jgi:hypothetical protein